MEDLTQKELKFWSKIEYLKVDVRVKIQRADVRAQEVVEANSQVTSK